MRGRVYVHLHVMASANVYMHSPSHARVMHVYVTRARDGECKRGYALTIICTCDACVRHTCT